MRISADSKDVGYLPGERQRGVRVILNGTELSGVVTADEEQGYVLRVRCDGKGRIMADGDVVATEELRGTVEIILP